MNWLSHSYIVLIISFILVFKLVINNRDAFTIKTIFSNIPQIYFDIFVKYTKVVYDDNIQ